jgi:hypothetical protein
MGWTIWGLNQVQISPGAHAASYLTTGVLRGLGSAREVVHSSPSSLKVTNEWIYTSTTPYVPLWRGQEQLQCLHLP